jgi:hypothetical protein
MTRAADFPETQISGLLTRVPRGLIQLGFLLRNFGAKEQKRTP